MTIVFVGCCCRWGLIGGRFVLEPMSNMARLRFWFWLRIAERSHASPSPRTFPPALRLVGFHAPPAPIKRDPNLSFDCTASVSSFRRRAGGGPLRRRVPSFAQRSSFFWQYAPPPRPPCPRTAPCRILPGPDALGVKAVVDPAPTATQPRFSAVLSVTLRGFSLPTLTPVLVVAFSCPGDVGWSDEVYGAEIAALLSDGGAQGLDGPPVA